MRENTDRFLGYLTTLIHLQVAAIETG